MLTQLALSSSLMDNPGISLLHLKDYDMGPFIPIFIHSGERGSVPDDSVGGGNETFGWCKDEP